MVPDDKATTYAFSTVLLGLCLCVGLFLCWLLFFGQPPGSALDQRADVSLTSILLVGSVSVVVSWRRWRRINQRRQAAASGMHGGAPLVAIQPFPNEAALAPRTVIVHKRSLLREIMWSIEMYIGGIALFTFIADFPLRGREWAAFFMDIRSSWPGAVGYLVSLGMGIFLRSPRTELRVGTFGLTLSTPTKTKVVRWEDARLFAVRGPRTSFGKAVTYELASASEVITWKTLRRLHWWSIERPTVPFEEYERQMEALLSLIAARTHLSLYDVRQEAG